MSIADTDILFNGQWLGADTSLVKGACDNEAWLLTKQILLDRAQGFGDAVFETILVNAKGIHLKALHLARLQRGLQTLDIEFSADSLASDLELALNALQLKKGYFKLKLIVSRGSSTLGYGANNLDVNRMITLQSVIPPQINRLELMLSSIRLSLQPALAGIKHCCRLEQVLAKQEQDKMAFDDALLLDQQGAIIEAISSNIFLLEDNTLVTPVLDFCGVAGVMREFIMQTVATELGFRVQESAISLERLQQSEGLILTNALVGVKIATSCQLAANDVKCWSVNKKLEKLQKHIFDLMYGE